MNTARHSRNQKNIHHRAQAPTDVGVHWAEKLWRRVVADWNGVRRQAMVETRLGAIVPATEPDFSCCDSLFGGERPCKGRPRPRRRVCFFLTPTEPSLTHLTIKNARDFTRAAGYVCPTGVHSQAFKEAPAGNTGLVRRGVSGETQRPQRRKDGRPQ